MQEYFFLERIPDFHAWGLRSICSFSEKMKLVILNMSIDSRVIWTTQLKIMNEFIKSQIVRRVQHKLGEDYEITYPQSAIQELLYNAVIHRDYQPMHHKIYDPGQIELKNQPRRTIWRCKTLENFPNKK